MVERWHAARAEADAEARREAREAAAPSLELLEERKRRRIAEWRETVAEDGNTNFVPAGDWRARVARAKQRRVEEST